MKRIEQITLTVPAGTRARIASISKATGMTKEAIFAVGVRAVFLQAQAELESRVPKPTIAEKITNLFTTKTKPKTKQ